MWGGFGGFKGKGGGEEEEVRRRREGSETNTGSEANEVSGNAPQSRHVYGLHYSNS